MTKRRRPRARPGGTDRRTVGIARVRPGHSGDEYEEPPPPSQKFELALQALFFASGATSLVYETLWVRHLHLLFGTSQLALSTVLAAFMGGLAAGGFAGARWARRVANPVVVYAVLEGSIGAYALAFPALERGARGLFLGMVQSDQAGLVPRAAIQLVLAGILLLPPTLCMGATLPLLVRVAAGPVTASGTAVGRLYGANTLGAMFGTGVAGFLLLPTLGLTATNRWTAAANGLLAVLAAVAARVLPTSTTPADHRLEEIGTSRPRVRLFLLILAAATGFTGLLYEVAWFRLMTLLLGGSAYAFSIMLLAFLLGIGMGGFLGGRAVDRSSSRGGSRAVLRGLARIEIGIGLLSWAAMFAYGRLPSIWLALFGLVEGSWPLIWGSQLAMALAIMTPPAILMGASFPYLTQLAGAGSAPNDRAVGLIYGANTLGGIAGAVAGALVILPVLHVRGAVLAAVSINVLIATLAQIGALEQRDRIRPRAAGVATAALAAIALAWLKPPPWDPLIMTSGVYQYVRLIRSGHSPSDPVARDKRLLFYDEGLTSVVTVAKDEGSNTLSLANNGKIDASTRGDLKTQILLGQLGFTFRPDAREALVVGLASGITAGSVALRPGLRQIDIVEIEPVVVAASHYFDEHNHRPLDDPRVRLVLDDARSHLMRIADGHYDVVVSEPSNPWLSGVSNLFTREFFELGKRKLSATGAWVQWLHCYEMSPDDLRSLLATFADVYPEVVVFRIDPSDIVLVGSRSPLRLSAAAIRSGLAPLEAVTGELERVGIVEPEDLIAHYLFGRDRLLELAGDIERNTDDNMRVEYSAPLHLYDETTTSNDRLLLEHAELPVLTVDGVLGLFALANGYSNLGLDERAAGALATAHQLALGASGPP